MKQAHFSIKYGQALGERLVLQHVPNSPLLVQTLREHNISHTPGSITIGYYRQLKAPEGAWCFMPVDTDEALAMLTTRMVQTRIAKDLIRRILDADRYNTQDSTLTINPSDPKEI